MFKRNDKWTWRLGLSSLCLFVFFVGVSMAHAAGWTVAWKQPSNTSSANYNFAVTSATYGPYVYDAGWVDYNKNGSLGSNTGYQIEKRNASNGALIWSVSGNPTGGWDLVETVIADANYVYVGVEQGTNANGEGGAWRVEKRRASNGSLVWARVINPTGYSDYPVHMVESGGYLYLIGIQNGGGGNSPYNEWRIEKRRASDGALIWAHVYTEGLGGSYPFGIAVSGGSVLTDGRYDLGENSARRANWQCVVERRSAATGGLIWHKYYNPSNQADACRSIAANANYVYVEGYATTPSYIENGFIHKRRISDGSIVNGVVIPNGGSFWEPSSILLIGSHLYSFNTAGVQQRDPNSLITTSSYLGAPVTNLFGVVVGHTVGFGASGNTAGLFTVSGFYAANWYVNKILPPTPQPATIDSFSASPTQIPQGGTSVLSWSSSYTSSCSINGQAVAVNGTKSVGPLNVAGTHTYSLQCKGAAGTSAPKKITVTVVSNPSCTLSVAPATVPPSGSAVLTWNTSHAVSGSIDNGVGTVSLTPNPNSKSITAPSALGTYTYTMTVNNSLGVSKTCATNPKLSVVDPCASGPTGGTVKASPDRVQANTQTTVTLNWSLQNYESSKIPPQGCYIIKNGDIHHKVGQRLGSNSNDTVPASSNTCSSASGTRTDTGTITNQTVYSIECNGTPVPGTKAVVNVNTIFNEF